MKDGALYDRYSKGKIRERKTELLAVAVVVVMIRIENFSFFFSFEYVYVCFMLCTVRDEMREREDISFQTPLLSL